MNPMLESLNRTAVQNPVLAQISQLKQLSETFRNPGGLIQNAANTSLQNHPMYAQAKQIADRYGGDWDRAFRETAKQNGIDPDQIVSTMRQSGLI